MKIISLSYKDISRNWGFENLEFQQLTLLVGASGVGKTQILRAIKTLQGIASGQSYNGVEWFVSFEIEGVRHKWEGAFELKGKDASVFDNKNEEKFSLAYENIFSDGREILDRNKERILFEGKETVKLSSSESAVHLLKEEQLIYPIYWAWFQQVVELNANLSTIKRFGKTTANLVAETLKTLINIQNSKFDVVTKLLLADILKEPILQTIKERYTSIFPQVEDVRIGYFNQDDEELVSIQIKEHGVDEWIAQNDISSGMYRSLLQIAELYLCASESVILMDEFENSLGVNCIDELTNDILDDEREVQFILTSHHPYIINNIPLSNWKIVTRKGGMVSVKNAADYRIGESSHDAFIQLIQLDEYTNGVS